MPEGHGGFAPEFHHVLGGAPQNNTRTMILLDTNVVIYARDQYSPFNAWARQLIMASVDGGGAAINPVSLAELQVGASAPELVASEIVSWGIDIVDLPAKASEQCASAYRLYRQRRMADSGKTSAHVPLPDFFIGAHAATMGWEIATADSGRFKTYFLEVKLLQPSSH